MSKNIYKKLFQIYKSQIQEGKFKDAKKTLLKIQEINPAKGRYHFGLLYPIFATKVEKDRIIEVTIKNIIK